MARWLERCRAQPIRAGLWNAGFQEVQKERKRKHNFLTHPSLVPPLLPLDFHSFGLIIAPCSFEM